MMITTPPRSGECRLWWSATDVGRTWTHLLSDAERERAARFASGSAAQDTFVTSRATQRLIAADYLGTSPGAVEFNRTCAHCGCGHGRPRIEAARIDYSVSHSGRWVVVAIVGTGLVGVDLEAPSAVRDIDGLAAITMTAREHAGYTELVRGQRAAGLFDAWTRKEAAMKLTGLGLRAPPSKVDVSGLLVDLVGTVPGWPTTPIWLRNLDAPSGYQAALASTTPVTRVIAVELGAGAGRAA